MVLNAQIAKHFRELHFGGNWTDVSFKDHLGDVDWKTATRSVYSLNSIAALVYHMNYYVVAVTKVLQGGPLDSSDRFAFSMPPIASEEDWQALLDKTWSDAERFAQLIEGVEDARLSENLADEKYGSYYRNFHGIIEHSHYHLGQIVLIRKILAQMPATEDPSGM